MKTGLGIVTYKRKDYFEECINRVPLGLLDEVVVVNDGTPYDLDHSKYHLIQNEKNLGVGKTKNKAMQYLLDKGCDHIFIMEDDILIKRNSVFKAYIDAHNKTGIHHFNFGLHGLANKLPDGRTPNPRTVIDYDKIKIALNMNCVGAFSYYTRKCLLETGLIDENFYNAFDHVEHTYQLILKNFHPPFWWFADLADSREYLGDIPWSPQTSTVNSRPDHSRLMQDSLNEFRKKHGIELLSIPNKDIIEVKNSLKNLYLLK